MNPTLKGGSGMSQVKSMQIGEGLVGVTKNSCGFRTINVADRDRDN